MGATSLLNKYRVSRPKNLSKYYKYVDNLKYFQLPENLKLLNNYV